MTLREPMLSRTAYPDLPVTDTWPTKMFRGCSRGGWLALCGRGDSRRVAGKAAGVAACLLAVLESL